MHTLICGVTLTGKTTLARDLCRSMERGGANTVVFDPVGTETKGGGWGEKSVVFSRADEFLAYMARDDVCNAAVFVDEASEIFSLRNPENFWLMTRGRHFGLSIFCITQRPKLVAPTVRTQCGRAYLFRLARDDMREIGADFGHSGLDKIDLDRGEFVVLDSGAREYRRAHLSQLHAKESS